MLARPIVPCIAATCLALALSACGNGEAPPPVAPKVLVQPAGASNPGVSDLSTLNGVNLGCRNVPLSLGFGLGTRPTIGQSFGMTANGIQSLPNGVFCILLISTEIPGGVPLDGLGLTGCTAYVNLPEIASFFNLTIGAPSTAFSVAIPNNNVFLGLSLMTQAISDDLTANAFGYRVSNGVRWNIGGL